jgi:hypothetical protein
MKVRKILWFFGFALLLALLRDGWLFYSRWSDDRAFERARAEKEAEQARRTIDLYGGGGLKILNFYASPGEVHAGSEVTVCYSVVGAKNVRIEPAVKELHPSLSYCFQITPKRSTEYKLIAEDEAGHSASQTLTIPVVAK